VLLLPVLPWQSQLSMAVGDLMRWYALAGTGL